MTDALLAVPALQTRAIDAAMRLRTALRDREAQAGSRDQTAGTNGRRTG